MVTDEYAQQLHTRSAQGDALTNAERATLEAWYAKLDAEEEAMLSASWALQTPAALQEQINLLLVKLQVETARLKELDEQNEALRQEIAGLKQRLAEAVARPQR